MRLPDPQDQATLERSTLDRGLADSEHSRQRRALWTDVLAWRRTYPALGVGRRDLVEILSSSADMLVLVRGDADGGRVLLAVNLTADNALVALPQGSWRTLLCSEDPRYGGSGAATRGDGSLDVPARSATLLLDVANA